MSDTPESKCRRCDECGSRFFADASTMSNLCPECAHRLYGMPPCVHDFIGGQCRNCGWDGSVSPHLARGEKPKAAE